MSNRVDKNIVILYGSQTGNSQDLAERIWRKLKYSDLNPKLSSFDKFELSKLADPNLILICVCSTTGQGDYPDNMALFWRSIMRKGIPSDFLNQLEFCVVGLGDSSYEKYNFTSKKLHKRLIQLGGNSILDLCLCDEQQREGIEGSYSKWIQNLFQHLKISANASHGLISKYKLEYIDDPCVITEINNEPATDTAPFYSKLLKNERATHIEHWQNTRFIELDSSTDRIRYEAGDVLMLRPNNLQQNVDKFLEVFQHLNLDLNKRIRIVPNFMDEIEADNEIQFVHTVGDLVEKYFDLNSMPRMSFFEIFSELAVDELEKEKLKEFMTPEGLEDLYDYCYRPRRTIIEIFYDFPKTSRSIKSLDVLLDLMPSIKPRSFSIASSPNVHINRIQILVAVVEYKTRLYETRKGTCSYWLSTLDPDSNIKIPIWIKKGSFKIDLKKPVICIGPGTGVAPFRSIINERIYKHNCDHNYLYFGCRSRTKDYYFESEWEQSLSKHPNFLSVNVAFSRDQDEKVYVQDLLLKNSDQIFKLLNSLDAYILIAGNSKRMPEDVLAILEKIIAQNLNEDLELAKTYMKNLETSKRIQLETWS